MTIPQERIKKLPKWAQDYINKQERIIQTQQDSIHFLQKNLGPTSVFCKNVETYLPDGSVVEFSHGKQKFNVCIHDGVLTINAYMPFKIEAYAVNHIKLVGG